MTTKALLGYTRDAHIGKLRGARGMTALLGSTPRLEQRQ